MITINLFYFIISCLILLVSGIFLVKSLTKISKFLGISEFSAAFIIMAFAASIPELFVGISSAISGTPELSLGNIIGANILNLTLISGIIILSAKHIDFKTKKIGSDVYFMLLSILLLIVLFTIGNELSRIDGIILLVVFIYHTYEILKRRRKYKKTKTKDEKKEKISRFYWLLIFMTALIGLFIGSNLVVQYSSKLALDFGLTQIVIGLFIISFATTLPDLIFGLSAAHLKHKDMAIGNQIGSVVTTTGLVLGIVALIHPIKAGFMPFITSAIFLFVSGFIFYTFIKSGKKLSTYEGISLILIYVLFIMIEFFIR
ncbi:MAG: hypothetical protein ABIH37_01070 [archaeon]